MSESALFIAAANLVFCLVRLFFAARKRRLISVCWFLLSYFSFFYLMLLINGPPRISPNDVFNVRVDSKTYAYVSGYMLGFNVLFATGEYLVWRLLSRQRSLVWSIPRKDALVDTVRMVFGFMLLVASVLYGITMHGQGYRGYVQFEGSNWPSVFFAAATPFITFSALQKRYVYAVVGIVPFLFFAVDMQIRSYALTSLIPCVIIILFSMFSYNKQMVRKVAITGLIFLVLSGFSSYITFKKNGKINFPDSGLPVGMTIAFEKTFKAKLFTEWNSLNLYYFYTFMPFYKAFQIPRPNIEDTPEYIARLIGGVSKGRKTFFHYPVLCYTDAFISFADAGVFLGLLWGVIISLMEVAMLSGPNMIALILPYYVWHNYNLIRGSTALSASYFSYCIYITFAIYFLAKWIVPQVSRKYRKQAESKDRRSRQVQSSFRSL